MKLNQEGQKEEVRRLEWWEALTPGEKKLIGNLMRMLRGAKHSQIQDVARAAAKWERGIGCFIKVSGEERQGGFLGKFSFVIFVIHRPSHHLKLFYRRGYDIRGQRHEINVVT